MTEKSVEQYLVRQVKRRNGLCFKWVSPGHTGVPDRIIILPKAPVCFAELKAAGGRLSPTQVAMHRQLREAGARVVTLYGKDDVEELLNDL